jgi:hypothetical protein
VTELNDNKELIEDKTNDIEDIERQEAQLAARKAQLRNQKTNNVAQKSVSQL